jgi:hypothetical protein
VSSRDPNVAAVDENMLQKVICVYKNKIQIVRCRGDLDMSPLPDAKDACQLCLHRSCTNWILVSRSYITAAFICHGPAKTTFQTECKEVVLQRIVQFM